MTAQNGWVTVAKSSQQGAAAVELIFVLPLLLLLLAVIVETGRIFHEYDRLLEGVRSAARYLAENEKHTVDAKGCLTMNISSGDITTANQLINNALGGLASSGNPAIDAIDHASSVLDLLSVNSKNGISISAGSDCVDDHVQVGATYTHTIVFSWYTSCGNACSIPLRATAVMRTQ